MDQAIAVEWGRFLRELESRSTESLKESGDTMGGGKTADGAMPPDDAKNAVLQRLQDALAVIPAPEEPLFSDTLSPTIQKPDSVRPRDATDTERSLMQQYARRPVDRVRVSPLKTSSSDASPAAEPKLAMNGENAQSQSNGAMLEDRPDSLMAAETTTAAEMQMTATDEEAVEQKAPSAPAGNQEGEMWKSVTHMDSAAAEQPASAVDAMRAAHSQEASRWFVLKGMLGGAEAPEKAPDQAPQGDVPLLEVFSLAGGVGKTSLVAALGRALSARGEHVLLVEATFLGSLQYFFGATDCRPGVVRTFRPPSSSSDAPIRLATVDPDALLVESTVQGSLAADIQRWAQGASRVIVDVATGATAIARGLLRKSTVVLVPLIPDVHAIVTASSIDAFFQRDTGAPEERSEVYYLLNQFDSSLPLHLDVRGVLREKLGERMLPFVLPRTPAVSEALAEGMTIMDYAPDSPATEDFISLAKWLNEVLAPADMSRRGLRWSER